MRTAMRLTASRFMPPVNVTISNVPRPAAALHRRCPDVHYYPVSTILDGQGLNITVQSYLDPLDFGLVACRELRPDVWDLRDAIVDDLGELAEAARVDRQVDVGQPPKRITGVPGYCGDLWKW